MIYLSLPSLQFFILTFSCHLLGTKREGFYCRGLGCKIQCKSKTAFMWRISGQNKFPPHPQHLVVLNRCGCPREGRPCAGSARRVTHFREARFRARAINLCRAAPCSCRGLVDDTKPPLLLLLLLSLLLRRQSPSRGWVGLMLSWGLVANVGWGWGGRGRGG